MPASEHYIRPRAPLATDDRSSFYFEGAKWTDESGNRLYRLDDDSPGVAVWTEITSTEESRLRAVEVAVTNLQTRVGNLEVRLP